MRCHRLLLTAGILLFSLSANAEWWGAPAGRSANPANGPDLSVEGVFSTSGDYDYLGARVNYQLNESITLYGDVGQGEFVDDDLAFGAGLFYYLPGLSEKASFLNNVDVAAQGSYHMLSADFVDISSISGSLLFSGREALSSNGLMWYANAGFTRLEIDVDLVVDFGFGSFGSSASDDSFELQLGGGVYLPMGPGELYAGADLIDEFILAVGYRYGIN